MSFPCTGHCDECLKECEAGEVHRAQSSEGVHKAEAATAKEHVRQFRNALSKQAGEMRALSAVYANPQLQGFVTALADDLEAMVKESKKKLKLEGDSDDE